jgi:hypothetical protein
VSHQSPPAEKKPLLNGRTRDQWHGMMLWAQRRAESLKKLHQETGNSRHEREASDFDRIAETYAQRVEWMDREAAQRQA